MTDKLNIQRLAKVLIPQNKVTHRRGKGVNLADDRYKRLRAKRQETASQVSPYIISITSHTASKTGASTMLEPQRDYDSHNIPGQPFGRKVIVTSKLASIEPPQPKNHMRSHELVEVRNGTDSKSSTTKSHHGLKDELFSLTDELSSLTDELSFLTGELSSLTGELSSLTGRPPTRTDELSAHTDKLHAHASDELCCHTADLYSCTVELYSRIDELKEKNLAFHKKIKTTGQLNSASVSTIIDPLEVMERDTSHSDEFKINVRLLKFFAEEADEELQKWEDDDFGDIGFFADTN